MALTELRPEVVSRCDWAFDYHMPIIDFDADCFVSRATKDAIHREHTIAQTFTLGRGNIVVRVYDKVAEIAQQSGKSWFHELWGRDSEIWRIEFQVRGERLKEAGIRTVADLNGLSGDLLRELAQSHTSLRQPNGDTNRSRWPLHPLWQSLLNDISPMPQTGLVREIDPQAELGWRRENQLTSVYGDLKGLGAVLSLLRRSNEPISLEDLLGRLLKLLQHHHTPSLWNADVLKRMTAYRYGKW